MRLSDRIRRLKSNPNDLKLLDIYNINQILILEINYCLKQEDLKHMLIQN